jgi:SAM-dependent methyltransferase
MQAKPRHLAPEWGAQFRDESVAEAYPYRPPYPAATFDALDDLIVGGPKVVLDVGGGTGDIARRLAPLVARLDAVDASAAMIAQGRQPGGDAANLNWIEALVEEAELSPPYGLITAGESLHWLDWEVVLPRFAEVLDPQGWLALIERDWGSSQVVTDRVLPIIARHSTNRDFRPYNLIAELTTRGLFKVQGTRRVGPEPWQPTIDEYIECRHSQNGLSRERMGASAAAFDQELRAALRALCDEGVLALHDDRLTLQVTATLTWGRPQRHNSTA